MGLVGVSAPLDTLRALTLSKLVNSCDSLNRYSRLTSSHSKKITKFLLDCGKCAILLMCRWLVHYHEVVMDVIKYSASSTAHYPPTTTPSTQKPGFYSIRVEHFPVIYLFWKVYSSLMLDVYVSVIWLPLCNTWVTNKKNIVLEFSDLIVCFEVK